ncbi:ABC transporter [Bacillus sp. AFS076308]|uniref:ABC transporter ATP-binding protein n=1 Tax=unclassified Bacillus (in: firmicutes) TaxID=185979 RepID=UPI000BF56B9F|nr:MULTISPECIES: ABC transporter ATP-binding protein [unclassified Bacillus (in: firmicutes)]PFN97769.1 ABC transporter [Bacillus sp. AFS076308]PGV51105.1 ABC transporter [Bacillus sp. AFS037270]
MALIELNNVTFTYPDCTEPAIRNLSLNICKGQFVVLFGASGSGKSTLLRLLKKEIQPHGTLSGGISINGQLVQETPGLTRDVGFVFQDPENQIVADDVLHEIVFGLENIGLNTNEMRNRVAEIVHFFGAESILNRKAEELSGGKKQQINLASVLLMQPNILLLDEPTAQLDPVSTREFMDMIKRLNEEFGMTIIMAEHRLEEVFTLADQIIMMQNGQLKVSGEPKEVLRELWDTSNKAYVPKIPALFLSMEGHGSVPLTVKEGRDWVQKQKVEPVFSGAERVFPKTGERVKVNNLSFHYDKKSGYILDELELSLKQGEFYALLGGNGSGKSTLLKIIAGLLKPDSGKVSFDDLPLRKYKQNELAGKIGYLPQNPKLFFLQDTVQKELQITMEQWKLTDGHEVKQLLDKLGIAHLLSSHPYDLSGGELQKAALACILIRKPEVLLLDEPTKGLDPISKENLAKILLSFHSAGMTILMSTHDVEFAAQYTSKCGMMFQGKITSEDVPEKFFKGNFFYTTMMQRVFRGLSDSQIPMTLEEATR